MVQSVSYMSTQPIEPPSGIGTVADIKRVQRALGVKDDGIWGPITQEAYEKVHQNSFADTLSKAVAVAETQQAYQQMNLAVDTSGAFGVSSTDSAYLDAVLQQNAVLVAQRALGVEQTGVWDIATSNAYNANPDLLHRGSVYRLDGSKTVESFKVMSGNVRTPWATEDERCRINDAFASVYGFAGYDGCGGIFGRNGMSSNPYYVQDKTGMTREQLNANGLSSVPDAVLGSDLWRQGFLQLEWNGYSVHGNGLGWPPNLIKQPQSMGLDVFRGTNNGYVNWGTLLSAQPSTQLGYPVSSSVPIADDDTDSGGWTSVSV